MKEEGRKEEEEGKYERENCEVMKLLYIEK